MDLGASSSLVLACFSALARLVSWCVWCVAGDALLGFASPPVKRVRNRRCQAVLSLVLVGMGILGLNLIGLIRRIFVTPNGRIPLGQYCKS